MTLQEFEEWIEDQDKENKIVFMRTRFGHDGDWDYDNELLLLNGLEYEWEIDWYEGQDEIEILGCIDVRVVNVPLFEEGVERECETES